MLCAEWHNIFGQHFAATAYPEAGNSLALALGFEQLGPRDSVELLQLIDCSCIHMALAAPSI